jgi:hypothetical protein
LRETVDDPNSQLYDVYEGRPLMLHTCDKQGAVTNTKDFDFDSLAGFT